MSGDATVTNTGVLTIASDAITTGKILDGEVQNGDLAGDAVTTDKILDATIVTADIGADEVQTTNIAGNNVTLAKIVDGTGDEILSTDGSGNPQYETKSAVLSAFAGNGLVASGGALDVNVDNSTLEINADVVRVVAQGITNNEIGLDAVRDSNIDPFGFNNSLLVSNNAGNAIWLQPGNDQVHTRWTGLF